MSTTRHQFTGREADDPGALQYNRARYYSPHYGRFLYEDPIDLAGGDPNLYAYVGSDPVNRTDPSGLFWPSVGAAGAVAVGVALAGRKDAPGGGGGVLSDLGSIFPSDPPPINCGTVADAYSGVAHLTPAAVGGALALASPAGAAAAIAIGTGARAVGALFRDASDSGAC